MKALSKYILLLLLLFLIGLGFFYHQRQLQIAEIKKETLLSVRKQFSAAQSAFDKLSQNFYNDTNDYLARILYLANSSVDVKELRLWREEVLNRLYPVYRSAVLFGLDQFQIHDRNGSSFLRFHYRDRFGDDLLAVRPSIIRVLREKRFLKGFEVGKYVDGLRYIYPLFYDGEYVGSYEWVWNHEALIREMRRIYGGRYALLVEREGMKRIVFPREVDRRYRSFNHCPDFLYQRNALKLYGDSFEKFLERMFTEYKLCRRLERFRDEAFLLKRDGRDYLVSLITIRTISGDPYGYLIAINPENRIEGVNRLFLTEVLFLLVVLSLIYILLYRSYRDQMFVRTLIDSQKEIVILTNGERLKDANRAFFDFFAVESIDEFIEKYGCICHLFIEADGYVGRLQDGTGWLDYMKQNSRENRVIMFDRRRGEDRIFAVSLNHFDEKGLYVIVFRDITELEREKRHFKIESMLDHLTRIYNKRTFEHFLKDKLDDIRTFHRKDVALVMFDIDFFKEVNDQYGHRKGDEVLRRLASLVASTVRQNDFLARWGGEEFMIIMEGTTLKGACRKAEFLRQEIAKNNLGIEEGITCSFGVVMLTERDTTESAVERVDRYLYQAKEEGRNRVACPDEEEYPNQK